MSGTTLLFRVVPLLSLVGTPREVAGTLIRRPRPDYGPDCLKYAEFTPDAPGTAALPRHSSVTDLIRTNVHDKYSGLMKILHICIILVVVKEHLVQIGRIGGPTEYL